MSIGIRLAASAFMLMLMLVLVPDLANPQAGQAAEAVGTTRARAITESENWSRLRSMPREQRLALWEKLKEFDALGSAEKSAIRSLDARVAMLSPGDRANYRSVLRRYHQWVQGLTEEQRNALNSAPPRERMRLVTQLRAQDRTTASAGTSPLFLQVIDFTANSPIESGHRLKVWFDLTAEQCAEIERIPSLADRQKRLSELSQRVKPGPSTRLSRSEEDALMAKLEANPMLKNWLANATKKADPTKHEKVRRRIATNFHFIEHPPAQVETGNLMRFQSALPAWYRGQFDHLPPEEARRRLTILYRLVFPAPGEMPEPRKATDAQPKAPMIPATTPRPSAPQSSRRGGTSGTNPF